MSIKYWWRGIYMRRIAPFNALILERFLVAQFGAATPASCFREASSREQEPRAGVNYEILPRALIR